MSREVMVGDVGVGGNNPIRVQSMTTTLTKDVPATADQAERLVSAGCEIVRVTTPTPADARCLPEIRDLLRQRGVSVPLVADIHFSPQAAMVAADYADKVRVNPGNYVDSRKFAVREYTDQQYQEEVERAAERFTPLVLKCKERGIAMRIGTNHGSLSDRIMNRFGDTPEGMVESALEFVRVCESLDYHDIILSMKASNPKVMIAAYRLLAAGMLGLGMEYPFHLGVTEAGNAEDGRIKSAIGIGSLLEDGIGDTIRVSLTEEPEAEIPVARALAGRYSSQPESASPSDRDESTPAWDPYHYERRVTLPVEIEDWRMGGAEPVAVVASGRDLSQNGVMPRLLRWASPAGRRQPKPEAAWLRLRTEDDVSVLARAREVLDQLPGARLSLIAATENGRLLCRATRHAHAVAWLVGAPETQGDIGTISIEALGAKIPVVLVGVAGGPESLPNSIDSVISYGQELERDGVQSILGMSVPEDMTISAYRLLAIRAHGAAVTAPILLMAGARQDRDAVEALLEPSIKLGSLLCDGIGDAILIEGDDSVDLAFNILQAAGTRISKTDYVACPSCGRTLFDLQETTERIKSRTSHLVGVKLAIMGCIVNGPGEMADADFGYVGGAPGKVNLYVGKECVEKGVPVEQADDRLVELIKAHGKWIEADEDEAAEVELVAGG